MTDIFHFFLNISLVSLILAVFSILVVGLLVYRKIRSYSLRKVDPAASAKVITSEKEIDGSAILRVSLERYPVPKYKKPLEKQSKEFQEHSLAIRRKFRSRFQAVLFVHGTFAGSDPFGIIEAIPENRILQTRILKKFASKLVKLGHDRVLKDNGNFLPQYITLWQEILEPPIGCHRFHWSSENHHLGRLQAAANLAQKIDSLRKEHPELKKILLVGHSHAGQVFALFSQLMNKTEVANSVKKNDLIFYDSAMFAELQSLDCTFVTLGAPVRYSFCLNPSSRVLHIINDRSNKHPVDEQLGILKSFQGDYIQKLGSHGSDFAGLTKKQREAIRILDDILLESFNPVQLIDNLRSKRMVSPQGKTLLVDFEDESNSPLHGVKNLFGHGVYTKGEHILFTIRLILNYC